MKTKRIALRCGTVIMAQWLVSGVAIAEPPLPGAIFTTDSDCMGVNLNIYKDKDDVYLDGGPPKIGAAGLPDGCYYVQVTEPNGTLLGTSIGSGSETPVCVKNGEFLGCYQLSSILVKKSDENPGYDPTSNPGGVYKVWVSNEPSFTNNSTKTDNFKIGPIPESPNLIVEKFYDSDADGSWDENEPRLYGWKMGITDCNGTDTTFYTFFTPEMLKVPPCIYTIKEYLPGGNWKNTTPNPQTADLMANNAQTVEFGNVCLGGGNGRTLGFWSNANGQSLFGGDDLARMVALNLRDAKGGHFDPKSYTTFRTWLLNANATNMAYMLSAQLAAMELNVFNGLVNGGALIHAPGTSSANALGYATVNDVMKEANAELLSHGLTLDGSRFRAYQEALKNALDRANNNKTFVQPTPCPFTFAE